MPKVTNAMVGRMTGVSDRAKCDDCHEVGRPLIWLSFLLDEDQPTEGERLWILCQECLYKRLAREEG